MKKYEEELKKIKEKSRFRQIPNIENKDEKYIFSEGKKYLNLSSNDYLGLSQDKDLIKEFISEFQNDENFAFSSTSARLLTGENKAFSDLENFLKKTYKKEACLLFNSGYHANIGTISALNQKGCAIFSDKLNHASIIDGMKLSDGDFHRYKHLNYDHLETLLQKHQNKYEEIIIISESVFSMDGDIADIKKLIEIKNKYNAILIIDEAHSIGIFGENGFGFCESYPEVDLVLSPFGKAIASYGAFTAGNKTLIDYIINKARSFIFSTSIPPINALWTKWILEKKLPLLKEKRTKLLNLSKKLREDLILKGIETLGESQIVPIIIGKDEKTVKIAQKLKSCGYWVLPIRPPTVPQGSSRLRISLSATMMSEDIEKLPDLIQEALKESNNEN